MPLGCLRSGVDHDLSGLGATPFLRLGMLSVLHGADEKRSASDMSDMRPPARAGGRVGLVCSMLRNPWAGAMDVWRAAAPRRLRLRIVLLRVTSRTRI